MLRCAGTWYGLGLFLRDVHRPPEMIIRDSLLRLWILEFTYAYSLGFSKFSILALYWRFFGRFNIRVPIIILMIATATWLICRVCILTVTISATFLSSVVPINLHGSELFLGQFLTAFYKVDIPGFIPLHPTSSILADDTRRHVPHRRHQIRIRVCRRACLSGHCYPHHTCVWAQGTDLSDNTSKTQYLGSVPLRRFVSSMHQNSCVSQ